MPSRREILGGMLGGGLAAVLPGAGLADLPLTSPRPRARPVPGTAEAPADLIAAAGLAGLCGFALADAATGQIVESHAGDVPMPPASTLKAITALYAFERLGPAHRFATRVFVTGPVVAGVVQGDLILSGGGDPELDTDDLGDLVARVAAAGITGVTGAYLVEDGALPRLRQIAADQPAHVGYNPAISGLNLNYNRVHFEWKHGAEGLLMDARGLRFAPPVRMARVAVVDRDSPVFAHRVAGLTEEWTVARAALRQDGSRWLPVRNPAHYTGEVFQTLALAAGLRLPEGRLVRGLPAGARLVAEVEGAPLPDVLRGMLRWSTNLTAEVMGLAASGAAGGDLRTSGRAMADWAAARLGGTGLFHDHSGLGAGSRIAPSAMVAALAGAGRTGGSALLKPVLRDLAMADAEGAALHSAAGASVRVLGKTGTLNFVSGLVGYIQPEGGRELAFAIYCADPARRDALPMEARERPPGGRAWARRARGLQARLVARWAGLYA
ncbi:MAG: D-alanyl-D-alanine carboxypeptidase/D-alanyl-D-alanine-endopeptidase [Pseudomonadota bacterium]|jgi:D-alanyl-D-alanine carboxypeptidase/D-alanyl-D-alanine-endopeptidase (penicillin-binding protein 4)